MPSDSSGNDTAKRPATKRPRREAVIETSSPEAGTATAPVPFWKEKTFEALDQAEWESLCDGCGRCCLVKLEDEDTGEIHFTDVGCKLLDGESCQCSDYRRRRQRVRGCLKLTPDLVRSLSWLPPTCAYRMLAEGKDLSWWHPLVSGSPETVHEAGISVRGRVAASETDVKLADYPNYMVSWPQKVPRMAKPKLAKPKPVKCK